MKERRTRALRAHPSRNLPAKDSIRPHILENPHFSGLENLSIVGEKIVSALEQGLNSKYSYRSYFVACIIFQGESGFEKVVETALFAIES